PRDARPGHWTRRQLRQLDGAAPAFPPRRRRCNGNCDARRRGRTARPRDAADRRQVYPGSDGHPLRQNRAGRGTRRDSASEPDRAIPGMREGNPTMRRSRPQYRSMNTRRSRAATLFTAVLVCATPFAASAQRSEQFAEARAFIERAMQESGVPSVSVAVAKDGEIVWAQGFGYADLDRRIPATPNTMYSLASISKPMTATALMQLVERGRIDLDRPANDYLGAA